MVQDFTALPSTWTTQAPHWRRVAADMRPGQAEILAQELDEQRAVLDLAETAFRSPSLRRWTFTIPPLAYAWFVADLRDKESSTRHLTGK